MDFETKNKTHGYDNVAFPYDNMEMDECVFEQIKTLILRGEFLVLSYSPDSTTLIQKLIKTILFQMGLLT